MNEVLYGLDYIGYYFYLLYYKFIGYPLIIRFCVAIVTLCVLLYFLLALYLAYGIFRRKKEKRDYNRIRRRYYESVKAVSLDPGRRKEEEIEQVLGHRKNRRLKHREMRFVAQLLTEIKGEFGDEMNELNFQGVQNVFKMSRFFEREIQFGRKDNKVRALKSVQSINGYVSEAVLVRFLYHRKVELRNSARFAYMWLSQNNPFRFFDEDTGMKLQKWDMAELHTILLHRRASGFAIPNFMKWVNGFVEEEVQIFFVNEIKFFDQRENGPALVRLLNTKAWPLRNEIVRTLGALGYTRAESRFVEIYDVQPEYIKQNMLTAVAGMKSGNGIPFLRSAYETADDLKTKLLALEGLYGYGPEGREVFRALEIQAEGFALQLFAHVKNSLTNRV